jgi:mannose-6-phosphate isomerase-like protein (cupin superfamily)
MLKVVNLSTVANKIGRPFAVVSLVNIGDLALSVYICQGQVNWHKHVDEDELFLVHEGVIELETERGNLTLHSEELAVVPKGTAHRSGSSLRSVVVLIRSAVLSDRKNGHRTLYPLETDPPLEKVRLTRASSTLTQAYQAVTLAQVEDFEVLLRTAQGFGPSEVAPDYGALWLVVRGAVGIETNEGAGARLEAGELTVIPKGTSYSLSASEPSLLLTMTR